MQVVTISLIIPKSTLTSSSHPFKNTQFVSGAVFKARETVPFYHHTRRSYRQGSRSSRSPHHLAGYKAHTIPLSHAASPSPEGSKTGLKKKKKEVSLLNVLASDFSGESES